MTTETIVAQATAPGRGGVGIVRVSGKLASKVMLNVLKTQLTPRQAQYLPFYNLDGQMIDQGIALFFPNPNSFTGEDVLELQGHGGPVVMDMLIKTIIEIDGIRMARPGEFSERAFLNDKLDLTQAEAIADLIDASSEEAAKSALNSLQGEFSNKIKNLVESVIHLRIYVEAAIDFPEEEIDFLADGKVSADLQSIIDNIIEIKQQATQGSLIREGMKIVIAGRPNAGKSSLLNSLSGKESAIVTDIAGTTRDVLKEHIHIDGMPLHIIDTAGLREASDQVEKIGIERAWQEIEQADRVLFMLDSTVEMDKNIGDKNDPNLIWPEFINRLPKNIPITLIRNKVDQTFESIGLIKNHQQNNKNYPTINLSAKTGEGIEDLKDHLKEAIGFTGTNEGHFMARRRHLEAIDKAIEHLQIGQQQLELNMAGEILAEELRISQNYLNEITGEFSSDDLLGRIFSSFCIGK